jgi:hypothetical protein
MICKHCKREIHYCASCDFDDILDLGYCREDCLLKSDYFKKIREEHESLKYPLQILEFCSEHEAIILINLLKVYANDKSN